MSYRTYDSSWNRTGYADVPQYNGQADVQADVPLHCPECGGAIEGVGLSAWLRFRGWGPEEAHSGAGYVAWCAKQHVFDAGLQMAG